MMNFAFKLNSIYILLISILLLSCTGNQADQSEAEMNDSVASTKVKPSVEQQNISNVVDGYLQLKDALVASNTELTKEKAVQLLKIVDATQMPGVQQNIKEIANSDDLEKQRVYFDSLSLNVYKRVKEGKGNQQALYKQYCPMAFNNRGAFWLSNSEEIKNPYYGEQMLTCGKVEEVIETSN